MDEKRAGAGDCLSACVWDGSYEAGTRGMVGYEAGIRGMALMRRAPGAWRPFSDVGKCYLNTMRYKLLDPGCTASYYSARYYYHY